MIIVTGGVGFIGSNLVKYLNLMGHDDILIIDNFNDGKKLLNIKNLKFKDLIPAENFYLNIERYLKEDIEIIFHQGLVLILLIGTVILFLKKIILFKSITT